MLQQGAVDMDERIFHQLDRLQRGAHSGTRPPRHVYNDSSTEFSAYEGPDNGYGEPLPYTEGSAYGVDDLQDEPMTLDSFDKQLLRQPDYNSRQGQAALGRARLSLPPQRTAAVSEPRLRSLYEEQVPYAFQQPRASQQIDLSRFALDHDQWEESSSSPLNKVQHSSPSFKASQRRPAPVDRVGHDVPSQRRIFPAQPEDAVYEPHGVSQAVAEEDITRVPVMKAFEDFQTSYEPIQNVRSTKRNEGSTPVVQGINLISTHALPDRFRQIFPYPLFNAVQSKTFQTIYKTNDNFVLSAPTGSGKTAVLELAICRLINGFTNGSYKVVYQAPTKSLCSERQRDWQAKFGPLDLQCAELTGDTEIAQLRNVQHASVIITTPEKWDSVTRKWTDHQKLMQMVKLFLIDEVHILKEDRGATLEAVVSRMKSVGSDVRFIALSATVPNSDDIAKWLGKDPMNAHIPAARERFGEEFRPVRLQKHVCGYQTTNSNDFAFEKTLNAKLPEVIAKWSQRKPIMVFCFTRNACLETAKILANWWATKGPQERYWSAPRQRINIVDKNLRDTILSGVAFHHAGLSIQDRNMVEAAYLQGELNVICCTSTLAVGVNLPCHMVIIKNTVTYQSNPPGTCKEYSDLEIMQMLGRAGRPQFDDSAVAVIMTRQQRAPYYDKMISGQEILESCLHLNLIDHLNAEIGLGTVSSASSAKKWLSGTFLYVRLKENPEHYKIQGDVSARNLDERLEHICQKGIASLQEYDLVKGSTKLSSTEFGDAMARYSVHFETMKIFLALPPKSKVSEILSALSQAEEFKEIRFRAGEKPTYKDLNMNNSIKFPIPVNLDAPAHKVSLIIQSVLGAVDFQTEEPKQRNEYNTARAAIFQYVHRLVRCIVDCQLYLEDAVTTRNALALARSLAAQVWDDSPLHMRQLDGVGLAYVRKLAVAGIKSIEDIQITEAHRIEQVLSRNPPFGSQLQEKAKAFPKLRVSLKMMGEPFVKKGEYVTIKVKAEIGFLNDKLPELFQRKPIYVCLLAETSDGHKVHFVRMSSKKLNKGQDVLFSANLTSASQSIHIYLMCDEIAGTMRYAILRPEIPPIAFPASKPIEETKQRPPVPNAPNTSKRRASAGQARRTSGIDSDEFGDEELDDADLARAEAEDFIDIDEFDGPSNGNKEPPKKKRKTSTQALSNDDWEPQQLPNGNWACKHACNDKTKCKHMCCHEGLEKKPKPQKAKESKKLTAPDSDPKQTQLSMSTTKKSNPPSSTQPSEGRAAVKPQYKAEQSKEARELNRLHESVKTKTPKVPVLGQPRTSNDAGRSQSKGSRPRLSFMDAARDVEGETGSSDYGMDSLTSNDLPGVDELIRTQPTSGVSPPKEYNDFGPSKANTVDGMGTTNMGDFDFDMLAGGEGEGNFDFCGFMNDKEQGNDDSLSFNNVDDGDFHFEPLPDDRGAERGYTNSKPKNDNIFVGYSTDSAAGDLGLSGSRSQPQVHPTASSTETTSSKFFLQTLPAKRKEPPSQPSLPLNEKAELRARAALVEPVATDPVQASIMAPGQEGKDASTSAPDELEAWFMAEFGTEHFNWIG